MNITAMLKHITYYYIPLYIKYIKDWCYLFSRKRDLLSIQHFNIYSWLRFGLANAINTYYLSLKVHEESIQNYLLNLWSSAVNSQGLLCGQKQVWNVGIKAFWYTNYVFVRTYLPNAGLYIFLPAL